MAGALLEVEGLSVDLATPRGTLHAVRDVSLSIERGETVCLVGESGCGKSMTAYALMALLPRNAARTVAKLRFQDEDLAAVSEVRLAALRGNRIAMVFQEPMTALNPSYTIGDQLAEVHRRHAGSTRARARERAVELLQQVGITAPAERLSQYPHQLSGGLRQRVVIAMALMCGPALLIADEPTTALDVTIQAQILRLLIDLQSRLGIAMLLITHDFGVVARIAHRVLVMYAGEIVEAGITQAVFTAPRHPYTRSLMASIPVPGRTAPGERLGAIPGTVPSLVGEMRGCAFRDRCAYATAACAETVAFRREAGHDWRCVLDALPAEAA
jgi:peptide/nickel transport system ATP-binding protein